MKLTGARILMECLREQKVDTIFGYPGGTILNVYDALYDCKEITHILTSHEQGPLTRRTATPAAPARWACASPPPAPVQRT